MFVQLLLNTETPQNTEETIKCDIHIQLYLSWWPKHIYCAITRVPSIDDSHQTVKGCAEKRSHFRTVINAAHSAFAACHNFLTLHNDGHKCAAETYYCNHTCLRNQHQTTQTSRTPDVEIKALWIRRRHVLIFKSRVYG